MAPQPLQGHRLHSTREQAATIGLGLGLVGSVALTSSLAVDWSWSLGLTLAAMVIGVALYLTRPGLAIAAVLIPFAFVDEATPDAIPSMREFARILYGDSSGGLLAPRDVLLVLAAVAAAAWFPAARDRGPRLFGTVTWVMIITGACLLGSLVVGLVVIDNTAASVKGLRPFYTCAMTAFIVWRVLRSMPRPKAESVILTATVVVGGIIIAIAGLRIAGLAGTAVEIEGVPITYLDAATPYVLLCCVGIWAVALTEHRVDGRLRAALFTLALAGLAVAVASQRRAILLGYAAAALALLVAYAFHRRGGVVRSVRILAAVVAAVAVTVALVSVAVPGARGLLAERASTALSAVETSSSADSSLQYRVDESNAVYALAGRNLWTGIGPTTGFTPINDIFLPTDGTYTHNTYYTLPLRYGLWGILALVALVVGLVASVGVALFRDPPRMSWVLGGAVLALLPAIATAAFLTQTARWGVVLGVIIGAFDALTDPPPQDTGEPAAA